MSESTTYKKRKKRSEASVTIRNIRSSAIQNIYKTEKQVNDAIDWSIADIEESREMILESFRDARECDHQWRHPYYYHRLTVLSAVMTEYVRSCEKCGREERANCKNKPEWAADAYEKPNSGAFYS